MNQLGISLYPDFSNEIKKDREYLKKAHEYGFRRLFLCLLNYHDQSIENIKKISQYANQLGYDITIDISPNILNQLNISPNQFSFFTNLNINTIRLDEKYDGIIETQMSYNTQNITLELNASSDIHYLNQLMLHHPNINQLTTCHNYYPLRYSGLKRSYFKDMNQKIKQHHLKVSAFVTSQNHPTIGPWSNQDGLCTLEAHRDLPIDIQVKDLLSLGVNDILIGNAYASDEELKACQQAMLNPHTLHLEYLENSVIEDKIMDEIHVLRSDQSEYVARSTQSRIKYQKYNVFPKENHRFLKGDVIIINDLNSRYAKELQILLQNIPDAPWMNLVGRIPLEEHILFEHLPIWKEIRFIRKG